LPLKATGSRKEGKKKGSNPIPESMKGGFPLPGGERKKAKCAPPRLAKKKELRPAEKKGRKKRD